MFEIPAAGKRSGYNSPSRSWLETTIVFDRAPLMPEAVERAERRACFAHNRQRMQHSSLSCHAIGPAPAATSSRHHGRQMVVPAQAMLQRPPAYTLGDHDASLEVHSRVMGAMPCRVRVSEAWKEQLRREQRVHSRLLLAQVAADHLARPTLEKTAPGPDPLRRLRLLAQAAEPAPRPASGQVPRGPDHMRHVGQPSSPLPPSREEALRRLRKHGHIRMSESNRS